MRALNGEAGVSELQGSLILLVIILIAALAVKATIGDSMVSAALDFGHFKVWGAHNNVSFSKDAPLVAITSPPDGSWFYIDQYQSISGNVKPSANRSMVSVYFRLNGGPWNKAALNNNLWSSSSRRYTEGSYHVEAVAYDDAGVESPTVSSTFESVFRLYPDAAFVNDDVPAAMTSGDTYDLHIKYSNTGLLPWNDSEGYVLSPNNSTMSLPPIGMAGQQVQPNQNHVFNLTIVAPAPGNYTMGYQMRCSGWGWFGDNFLKPVKVVASYHDAKVVSMNMPSDMAPGETQTVSITMENTGTAAWYSDGSDPVYLGMVGGTGGDAFKFNGSSDKILMTPGTVLRNGSDYTFIFKITAPRAGSYYTQYRMMWANHYVFGQIAGCTINVIAAVTPTPTPTANPPGPGKPTPTPTAVPDQFNAHGKMWLYLTDGSPYDGCIPYYYDGPLVTHTLRASRGAAWKTDSWDWDIGGPNGHYRMYYDNYLNDFNFDMNGGGIIGPVIFYKNSRI